MKSKVEIGVEFVDRLSRYRSKTGVISGSPGSGKSQFVQLLSQQTGLKYLDITRDLLQNLPRPIGAFDHHDFTKYLLLQTQPSENVGVIVDNIEPLIATFGRSKAQAFFEAIALLEPRAPMVIITHLDSLIQHVHFPNERILKI